MSGKFDQSLRILIVDDDAFTRGLIDDSLRELGVNKLTQVSDGVEALKVIQAHPGAFDIIILDLEMPILDGIETLAKLRELPSNKGGVLPVIILTGNAQGPNVKRAISLGIHHFLVKPVSLLDLEKALIRAVTKPQINPSELKG